MIATITLALALAVPQPLEHWQPSGTVVELYRQTAAFQGATVPRHRLALDEGVAITIDDPKHDVARIRVALYSGNTLVLENDAETCPPHCTDTKSVAPAHEKRFLAVPRDFDAPATAVHANGYDVAFYGGFASRVRSSIAGELYRQQGSYFLLAGGKRAPRHEIRIAGGPNGRNFTLGIEDAKHEIASITIDLYDSETIEIDNDAETCPPDCQ